ncbi:hypothetical protein [Melittangium boletus]|uniref:Lipoprotein n=1 Tax=Melittangium boletus DSM 14713 TaxID=1294270 RepID=A0A250IHK3_9BACT|nr:hypothetical protein [Melittangium boletus]ATB31299.1 hypothetical protein MEBOL_004761 [Melittangium boletus DSM 14713]
MRRPIALWRIALIVWVISFGVLACIEKYTVSKSVAYPGRIDWLAVAILSGAVASLVVMIVQRIREQPTPEQRAALAAIFEAGPGTRGAVVVTRNGVPEVIATVRSKEEYLELAGSGQLPEDHHVYLPSDVV